MSFSRCVRFYRIDGQKSNRLTVYGVPCGLVKPVIERDPETVVGSKALSLELAPNPANPRTQIRFNIASPGLVTLRVFDPRGSMLREVFSGVLDKGPQVKYWDGRNDVGRNAASGLYFFQLKTEKGFVSEKLLLVR